MRISNTIIKPLITEKYFGKTEESRYAFKVSLKSTKGKIASEIERIFAVNVIDVATSVMPGKKRRILKTRNFKKTPSWKKSVVTLKKGQSIDLFPKE